MNFKFAKFDSSLSNQIDKEEWHFLNNKINNKTSILAVM